jgi:hypothetical protein
MSWEQPGTSGVSYWHLGNVISLYPYSEAYCAGYAPSRGRRCYNPISQASCRLACAYLEKGTELMNAGRRVDFVLEELATLVLCKRNHQHQAPALIERWKREIDYYWQFTSQTAIIARLRSVPRSRLETGSSMGRSVGALSQPRYIEDRPTRRRAGRGETPASPTDDAASSARRTRGRAPSPEQTNSGGNERHRNSVLPRREAQAASRREQAQEGTRRTTNSERIGRSRERPQISPPTRCTSTPPRSSQNSRPVPRQRSLSNPPLISVRRRSIEGDCSICIAPLVDSEHSSRDDLVWCRARCGINFHRLCQERWIVARSRQSGSLGPTCPMCRGIWIIVI